MSKPIRLTLQVTLKSIRVKELALRGLMFEKECDHVLSPNALHNPFIVSSLTLAFLEQNFSIQLVGSGTELNVYFFSIKYASILIVHYNAILCKSSWSFREA